MSGTVKHATDKRSLEGTYKLKIEHTSPTIGDPYHTFYIIYYLDDPLKYEYKFIYYKIKQSKLIRSIKTGIRNWEHLWLNNFINDVDRNKKTINYCFALIEDEYSHENTPEWACLEVVYKMRDTIIDEKNNIIDNKHGSVLTYNNYIWTHSIGNLEITIHLDEKSKDQFLNNLNILYSIIYNVISPYHKHARDANIRKMKELFYKSLSLAIKMKQSNIFNLIDMIKAEDNTYDEIIDEIKQIILLGEQITKCEQITEKDFINSGGKITKLLENLVLLV